jgi:hypothetical protein
MNSRYFTGALLLVGLIKLLVAIYLPLGNDEVYYLLYARYPDYHYYDHPLLIGWLLKVFSLNFLVESAFFYRLFELVLSTLTPLFLYRTVLILSNKLSAQITVLLYVSSIYFSIIAGSFVMPDAPFHFFWAVSIYYAVGAFFDKSISTGVRHLDYMLCCFFLGMTCLSKFHGVFLVAGVFLFILFYRTSFLKSVLFYEGVLLLSLFVIPVVVWNYQHDWVQFGFYLNRVEGQLTFSLISPLRELLGEIGYLNPVVFIFICYFAFIQFKRIGKVNKKAFLLLTSLPFILFVLGLSTFKETLPHWSGASYTSLIILASIVAGEKGSKLYNQIWLNISFSILAIAFILGLYLVNYFPGTIGKSDNEQRYGSGDFTLDMYGWEASSQIIRDTLQLRGLSQLPIVSDNWFPAGHIDNYICRPANIPFYCIGNIEQIHQYQWINPKRGDWSKYDSVVTIVPSNYFRDPKVYLSKYYSKIDLITSVEEFRSDKKTRNYFIYLLRK